MAGFQRAARKKQKREGTSTRSIADLVPISWADVIGLEVAQKVKLGRGGGRAVITAPGSEDEPRGERSPAQGLNI